MSIDPHSPNRVRLSVIGPVRLETADSEPIKLPRRAYQVLAGLALAPEHEMLRTDITEIVWPLSEPKSRDVLLHQTRRAILEALRSSTPEPAVVFERRFIRLDSTYIEVDYNRAVLIAGRAIESSDARIVLESASTFDQIARSAVLLADFPANFDADRSVFNELRHSVLVAGWSAAVQLGDLSKEIAFERRLRETGFTAPLSRSELVHRTVEINHAKTFAQNPSVTKDDNRNRNTKPQKQRRFVVSVLLGFGLIATILPMCLLRIGLTNKSGSPIFFTYPNNERVTCIAIGTKALPKGETAVLTSSVLSNGISRFKLHKISRDGQLRWSTPLEVSGFDSPTIFSISADRTGNIFAIGKVLVKQTTPESTTANWYPIVLRITSEGTNSNGTILPYVYLGDGSDMRNDPDHNGGVWVATHIAHSEHGSSLAVCHIGANGPLGPFKVLGDADLQVTNVFTSTNGSVVVIGSNGTDSEGKPIGAFITKLGMMGRTLWYTPINGTLEHLTTAVKKHDDVVSLLVRQTADPVTAKSSKKTSLLMVSANTGKVVKKIPLDHSDENSHYYLAASTDTNDYVIASTESSPGGSNNIGFIFANSASNEASLKISANIANTSRINGISYLSSAGSRTFRALVNVAMSGKNNQKATLYVHKDQARDIEISSLSSLGEVLPMNIDKGVAAINTGNTFQLMRLDDIR